MSRALKSLGSYIATRYPEIAKKKEGAGASRSALLKVIMPHISGDHGDALAKAVESGDETAFVKLWTTTTEKVLNAVKNKGSKTETKASGDLEVMMLGDKAALLEALVRNNIDYPSRETKMLIRRMVGSIKAEIAMIEGTTCGPVVASFHPAEIREMRKQLVAMKREQRMKPTKSRQSQIDALAKQIEHADAASADPAANAEHDRQVKMLKERGHTGW